MNIALNTIDGVLAFHKELMMDEDNQPKVLWRKANVVAFECKVVRNKKKPAHPSNGGPPWYAPAGIGGTRYDLPKLKLVVTGNAVLRGYLGSTRGYSHTMHGPNGCSEVHFMTEEDALACYLRFS